MQNVLAQEVQNVRGLCALETLEVYDEGGVVEQAFHLCDGVGAHEGMGAAHGGAEGLRATVNRVDVAVFRGVHCAEPVEEVLEVRAQRVVERRLGRPDGVAARGGGAEEAEQRVGRGVGFEGVVRVEVGAVAGEGADVAGGMSGLVRDGVGGRVEWLGVLGAS